MAQIKSEGFILKVVNWKENSRIFTFFTENAGRQSIVDRGGRSIKSKKGRLMTFTRMDLNYFRSEKTGTGYVSEADPLEIFSFEKEGTLGRLTFASAALEILYGLLPENEPMRSLYHLTVQYFRLIDRVPRHSLYPTFIAYFIKLVSNLGYRPNFAGCIGCGRELDKSAKSFAFVPERGGIVCSACQMPGEYYITLQPERLARLYKLQTSSLAEAAAVELKLAEAEAITELLVSFLKYQTETKELKTLKFLEKLKQAVQK